MGKPSRAAVHLALLAGAAAGVVLAAAILLSTRYLAENHGIDAGNILSAGGKYNIIPPTFFFSPVMFTGYAVYFVILRRIDVWFAGSFARDPRCYSCGYRIPEIVHDGGPLPLSESVLTCPECASSCPVVCVKDKKLVPVGAVQARD